MKYCSNCGTPVDFRIPEGDTLPRYICNHCQTIHYQNPKVIVGALVEHENRILLCKRAIEPRYNTWTLPAGFMENGEDTITGAIRETWEEACAHIRIESLYRLIDVPHISQVHLIYRAQLLTPDFSPGAESLEVALFSESEIPWDNLAFRTNSVTLRDYFADRRVNAPWPMKTLTLDHPLQQSTTFLP